MPKIAVTQKYEDALKGVFSVSATEKVHFSKGNLQYIDGTWRFADNQYDYLAGYSTTAWDLFGWSTTATSNNWGMHTMTHNTSGYTDGGFKDWGKAYCGQRHISEDSWRTLTNAEWIYLLGTTTTVGSCRYASNTSWWIFNLVKITKVDGSKDVLGLIIYPDGITAQPTGVSATLYQNRLSTYTISKADFNALEAAGCVFLPAAGFRNGTSYQENSYGYCWSASPFDAGTYNMRFAYNEVTPSNPNTGRYDGLSVRLVSEVN